MVSNSRYISVLASPTTSDSEQLTLRFRQINVNESFIDIAITGLNKSDAPADIARKIKDALNTGFATNNALYAGQPFFAVDGYPPFTLVAVVCDHVVNIFSQVAFQVSILPPEDTTQDITAVLSISDVPIFPTFYDYDNLAAVYGLNLPLPTVASKIEALKVSSNEVIRLVAGFRIAATTYMHEERGNFGRLGYKLDNYPVLYADQPVIRGPGVALVGAPSQDRLAATQYDIDYQDGLVSFLDYGPYQNCALMKNNWVRQSYVAGYANIPDVCKEVAMQVLQFVKYNPTIESLKQGAFQVRYRDHQDVEIALRTRLNQTLGR